MNDYLLFIDTEASGLPKDWNAPYSAPDSWPYNVQLAWVICSSDGREIKAENHYISDADFEISAAAGKIHGITREFLASHGEPRKKVVEQLAEDLQTYRPLLVGHFMQLDLHMMNVAFHRAGMDFPLHEYQTFCTMEATTLYSRSHKRRYLRLGELHKMLFGTDLEKEHDALTDARATARCFFELCQRGEVNTSVIQQQQASQSSKDRIRPALTGCVAAFLLFFIFIFLTYMW